MTHPATPPAVTPGADGATAGPTVPVGASGPVDPMAPGVPAVPGDPVVPGDLGREAAAERVIAFTDAAVAIALTLLVLPLMDSVTGIKETGDGATALSWLTDHGDAISGFLMSFALVAGYWTMHHGTMRRVRSFEGRMMIANLLWLLAIVILPVTSAITIAVALDPVAAALYTGNLALIALALTWLEAEKLWNPESSADLDGAWGRLAASIAAFIASIISFVLVAFTPLNGLGMAAMVLIWPGQAILQRLFEDRAERRSAGAS